MEVNGKNITGIFIYSPFSKYYEGDIVLKDKTMYVVKSTVEEEDPSKSDKYSIYLGDKSIGLSEYEDYINSPDDTKNDMYISVGSLNSILNYYMNGINLDGKMRDLGSDNNILYNLITDEKINFAVFSVSRSIDELSSLYPEAKELDQKDKLIIKQYTYTNNINETVRVQELIDHSQHIVWYRSMIYGKSSSLSSWGNISINLKVMNERLQELQREYKSRIDSLVELYGEVSSNFRYKPIPIATPSNKRELDPKYSSNVITIGILINNEVFSERVDLTIDLKSSINKYKTGDVYVGIEQLSNDGKYITLFSDDTFSEASIHPNAVIDSIVVHLEYE